MLRPEEWKIDTNTAYSKYLSNINSNMLHFSLTISFNSNRMPQIIFLESFHHRYFAKGTNLTFVSCEQLNPYKVGESSTLCNSCSFL